MPKHIKKSRHKNRSGEISLSRELFDKSKKNRTKNIHRSFREEYSRHGDRSSRASIRLDRRRRTSLHVMFTTGRISTRRVTQGRTWRSILRSSLRAEPIGRFDRALSNHVLRKHTARPLTIENGRAMLAEARSIVTLRNRNRSPFHARPQLRRVRLRQPPDSCAPRSSSEH